MSTSIPNTSIPLPALVVTDLDGTLLDHHSYDWTPARDALAKLEALKIPVIFNTSKTRAELEYWRRETDNRHPFIVENGSAIFIPVNYPHTDVDTSDYDIIKLGIDRAEILVWLQQRKQDFAEQFQHFAALNAQELIALTDLPQAQAELALQRDYSEAIHWHGDADSREQFIQAARARGYQVLIGGRFLHILGRTDKGRASRVLLENLITLDSVFPYTHSGFDFNKQTVTTIALGDSNNDIDMLEWVDIAVLIRSPHKAPPKIQNPQQFVSTCPGPSGWAEIMNTFRFTA